MSDKIAVVAFGGNAIIQSGEEGHQDEQLKHADEACDLMVEFINRGYELIVVHGNGPQVGNILIQMEEAAMKVPTSTLDVCVAMTQGSMGFMLENALCNGLKRRGIEKDVVVICSQVIVDRKDPRMKNPTKPVGPFFTHYRAKQLMDDTTSLGWMNEEVGKLENMIEEKAGPLATDGGFLAEDIYGNIPDLGWGNLTKTFLGT